MQQAIRLFSRRARALAGVWAIALAVPLASPAGAAVDLVTGVGGGAGIAFDEAHQHLYFVESTSGTLQRLNLTPLCDNPTAAPGACGAPDLVASGLTNVQDVAVDSAAGVAYVTTSDFPLGSSGALYAIDVSGTLPATPSLVAFNLRRPRQIVLDPPTHSAWVVGFGTPTKPACVWRLDLVTGSKDSVIDNLTHPVGLAVTADRTRAFVTEQGPSSPTPPDIRLSEFDLATGTRIRDLVTGASTPVGLTQPFFLRWTDAAEGTLYMAERGGAKRVLRTDRVAGATVVAISDSTLPAEWSGIAVNIPSGAVYVTTDTSVVRFDLAAVAPTDPIFVKVGAIVSGQIDDVSGYSTSPAFFHAPFGGTLDIFGNLTKFWGWGARSYKVIVDKDGGGFNPVTAAWTVQWWNPLISDFEARTVAPDASNRYAIPPEYDPTPGVNSPYRWQFPFLAVRWPSSADGLYTFRFQLFDASGVDITTTKIPSGEVNELVLRVDNSPPVVDLESIWQVPPAVPGKSIAACEIVSGGANAFQFRITARDPNNHLLDWNLSALFGKNGSHPHIAGETYSSHVDEDGAYGWSGESLLLTPTTPWSATCSCAHTFILTARKRTTNGYHYILHATSHQSITINNAGPMCPS